MGELKEMAVDMGSEIERFVLYIIWVFSFMIGKILDFLFFEFCRQDKALNPLQDDVDEINFRVRGANQRTRRLLGK